MAGNEKVWELYKRIREISEIFENYIVPIEDIKIPVEIKGKIDGKEVKLVGEYGFPGQNVAFLPLKVEPDIVSSKEHLDKLYEILANRYGEPDEIINEFAIYARKDDGKEEYMVFVIKSQGIKELRERKLRERIERELKERILIRDLFHLLLT